MSRSEHLNKVAPWFRARYPFPEALAETLNRDLTNSQQGELIADRVMARLGPDVVIGGARAANLPPEVMAQRIRGDLDVGLAAEAERLLAMPPAQRRVAIDAFVRGRLAADLGDYITLDLNLTEQNDQAAFYVITGRILDKKVDKMELDVDCDPHLMGPSSVRMAGFRCTPKRPVSVRYLAVKTPE